MSIFLDFCSFFLIHFAVQTLGKEGEEAIKLAIDLGYRHIDTAYIYGNEVVVGNAIRAKIDDGTIKREDIFVVTKVKSNKSQFFFQIFY